MHEHCRFSNTTKKKTLNQQGTCMFCASAAVLLTPKSTNETDTALPKIINQRKRIYINKTLEIRSWPDRRSLAKMFLGGCSATQNRSVVLQHGGRRRKGVSWRSEESTIDWKAEGAMGGVESRGCGKGCEVKLKHSDFDPIPPATKALGFPRLGHYPQPFTSLLGL